jgi:chromosome segregation ATPase
MRAEPLGSLLANRGHITEEQLELALTEQKVTGRPLGEIIVARGFAAAPTVAQALATQHGGLLKTEYGFATGWSGQEASEAGALIEPPRHDETATLRASLEEHQKALAAWKQSHAQLEERLAQMEQPASAEDDPRVAELEAERDALKAELAEAQQPVAPVDDPRVAELEAERDALKTELAEAQKPAPPVDDPRLAELEAERDALKAELAEAQTPAPPVNDSRLNQLMADRESLQAELTARETSIADLKASRAKVETARAELEQALAREVERGATLRAELEQLQTAPAPAPTPAGRWGAAESHLVFFQGTDGYELVERSGPPPSEGSSVGDKTVARIASAPIPGSALPCAYLVA